MIRTCNTFIPQDQIKRISAINLAVAKFITPMKCSNEFLVHLAMQHTDFALLKVCWQPIIRLAKTCLFPLI